MVTEQQIKDTIHDLGVDILLRKEEIQTMRKKQNMFKRILKQMEAGQQQLDLKRQD